MARRKNTKRIDPRYFMDEKTDIIKEQIEEIISEELNEMDIPDLDDDGGKYRYAKSMFYSNLARVLDEFVKESGGKFDESMKMRIIRGAAKVLGDRKQ
tara:strand:+ start:91 stop:384 length:294 start_codon:yes stop_codon:yes gene_type:complete